MKSQPARDTPKGALAQPDSTVMARFDIFAKEPLENVLTDGEGTPKHMSSLQKGFTQISKTKPL